MKRRDRTPEQNRKPAYNTRMIADFLDHLEWETRIQIFENTRPPGTINSELVDALAQYSGQYDCVGLIPANEMVDDIGNPAEAKRMSKKLGEMLAIQAQDRLSKLRNAREVIDAAIEHAAKHRHEFTIKRWKLSDLLRMEQQRRDGESAPPGE